MQITTRDSCVSMAKGIAIVLMVLAHARFSHYGGVYINMFHMPLFFFMSGYCFKEAYLDDFLTFSKKRIQRAYWPYVKWSLLFLLLHNVFFALNIYNNEFGFRGVTSQLYTVKDFLTRSLLIIGSMSGEEQLLGGYWFLHSYFFAAFISFFTMVLFKNHLQYIVVGGAFLLIASLVCSMLGLRIPYYIEPREILASAFIVTGFAYKRSGWRLEEKPIVILIGAIIVAIGVKYWPCNMLSLSWQRIVPYYLSSLAGILMVFGFCKFICGFKMMAKAWSYVGDRTLDILTWHFLSFKVVSLVIISVYGITISRLSEFPVIEEYAYRGWWVLYLFVGVLVPLLIEGVVSKIKKRISVIANHSSERHF